MRVIQNNRSFYLVVLMTLLVWSGARSASANESAALASDWFDTEFAAVRLISSTTGATPMTDDGSLLLGLEFQLHDDWKIYWRSPGDAGYPPKPDWNDSQNLESVEIRWPVPLRFSVLGLETLGYKKEVVFPLVVKPENVGEPLRLGGKIDYLICSDICIPETLTLALDVPGGDGEPTSFVHLISKYASRVPRISNSKKHSNGLRVESFTLAEPKPGAFEVRVTVNSHASLPLSQMDAYVEGPLDDPALVGFGKPVVDFDADRLKANLRIPVKGLPEFMKSLPGRAYTVTVLDGNRSIEFSSIVNLEADSGSEKLPPQTSHSTITILVFAFLGGLILNLMPCVLPVLSIKVISVINLGGVERRDVRRRFLASAAGILVSFAILAIGLIALKNAGHAIGWGIQFQHPWFLTFMALLVVVFACNLWGWFEFRVPGFASAVTKSADNQGLSGHFFSGMLATLLATPCSAPFLGTAVGFALSRGYQEILVIFLVMGLGLAIPYLLIAVFPGWATRLPKPGAWMVRTQQVLGLLLVGTGVWLVSVLMTQIGLQLTLFITLLIACVVIALFVQSRTSVLGKVGKTLASAGAAGAILLAITAPGNSKSSVGSLNVPEGLWVPFDQQAIAQQVREGKVVLVDVTADWCITCQVNKSFAFSGEDILETLYSDQIVPMQADWTLPDEGISKFLAGFGKFGIPFNAVYGPGAPDGLVLPELLSEDIVLEAIDDARG